MTLKAFCPIKWPDSFKLRKRINNSKVKKAAKIFDFMQLGIKNKL